MTDAILLKIVIGAVFTIMAGIQVRIAWDWLNKPKENKEVQKRLSAIEKSLNDLKEIIIGNGKPEPSIIFRLVQIESFIDDLKKPKDYRVP